ncbi:MAG: DegT/DnrJ/EryC1/StrS family aminotransferase, partial [Fusobacteriaceae bacterium]
MKKIPFNTLDRQFFMYQDEYEKKALDVLRSGWYILGPEVEEFEKEFSNYIGTKYCLGIDNGLNALVLAFRALGIKER